MARLAYALTSQGMGHSSRALVLGDELRRRGHQVLFLCGGRASQLLRAAGGTVFSIPVLGHTIRNNRVMHVTSLVTSLAKQALNKHVRGEVIRELSRFEADALINDFELYTARAAAEVGLPIITLNHAQILTHTDHVAPARYRWDAFVARGVIRHVSPRRPAHTIVSTFGGERPARAETTLVGPILRSSITDATPSLGEAVLVYHNDPGYLTRLIPLLSKLDARFVVYRPREWDPPRLPTNVELRYFDAARFVDDLARARAVISSAGFTLMSECLWLRKPLFCIPNRGQYEQTYNALYLSRNRLGAACFRPRPSAPQLKRFLAQGPVYRSHMRELRIAPGAMEAASCIQRVVARPPRPPDPRPERSTPES